MAETESASHGFYDRWRFLFSLDLGETSPRALRKGVQAETLRTMTVTAIALKRYQLRHGKHPAHLDALVPDLLPALAIDIMDGKPLRYRLNSDGGFTLYSVGEDGVDDGGNPVPPESQTGRPNFLRGRDLVWPTPASAEEIAAAEDASKGRPARRQR